LPLQPGKISEIDVGKFDAIVAASGQAPMLTYADARDLQRKFVEFYERASSPVRCVTVLRSCVMQKLSVGPIKSKFIPL